VWKLASFDACFVNPLTSQGVVETMRLEDHKALVHTAAASNLGQMLNKLCIADGVGLVNIVRSQQQADLLKSLGARYVCDSSAPTFMQDLTEAIAATGATLAFDAIGGGKLAGQILACMEAAINRTAKEYSRYGSATHKQVYIYGGLDTDPTIIERGFGMAWGVARWAAGCCGRSCKGSALPARKSSGSAWSPNSRRLLPATTPRRFRSPRRSTSKRSPCTASARRGRST